MLDAKSECTSLEAYYKLVYIIIIIFLLHLQIEHFIPCKNVIFI